MSELDPRKVDAAAEAALSDAAAVASDAVTADDRAAEAAQQARLQDGADLSAAAAAAAAADEAEGVKPPAEPGGAINGVMPIIFLDDIRVDFKTRTGSLLHPNIVHAVQGLTLRLMPGQTLGIVGESGCGKSTTANVMCGLQAPTSGKVYFKGEDVTKRTAAQRRHIGRVISVVFQDPATALNARMTIHDQLMDPMLVHKVGDKISREKRVQELIGMVGLPSSALDALPGQLSGGQRQRVAIARALLADCPILVLDEATSALDSESEHLVQDAFATLMRGRTCIVVAHRLSTVASLDRIVVLADGKVIEDGPHDELIAAGGEYAHLWSRQTGAYLE